MLTLEYRDNSYFDKDSQFLFHNGDRYILSYVEFYNGSWYSLEKSYLNYKMTSVVCVKVV